MKMMTKGDMGRCSGLQRGMTLTETMLFSVIFIILCILFVQTFSSFIRSLEKNKETVRATRLGVDLRTQVEAIDFFNVFSCDSSKPSFGFVPDNLGGVHCSYYGNPADPLQGYTSLANLTEMQNSVQKAGLSHFELKVTFLRRDRAATITAGQVGNTIPFKDAPPAPAIPRPFNFYTPGNGIDDSDTYVRYQDINGDGDYFDRFWVVQVTPPPAVPPATCYTAIFNNPSLFPCTSSGPAVGVRPDNYPDSITEMPDTRLKQVSLRIFDKRNNVVVTEGWVMGETGLSGNAASDWESNLIMKVESPVPPATLYARSTRDQRDSQDLRIQNAYPPTLTAIQADRSRDLRMKGVGVAMGDIRVSQTPSSLPGVWVDGGPINVRGVFDFQLTNITPALKEGVNILAAMSIKGPFQSPVWSVSLVYDTRPPVFGAPVPPNGSTVHTRSPFIGIPFDDDRTANVSVAEIEKSVIHVSTGPRDGDPTSFLYDDGWANYSSTWVVVADRRTGLLNPLRDGRYRVFVEGGDRAQYKANYAWTFTVDIPRVDGSPPNVKDSVGNPDMCDVTPGVRPLITCYMNDPHSGVDWRTIDFKIWQGGIPVVHVKGTDDRFGDYFDPTWRVTGGIFSYQVVNDLAIDPFRIKLKVKNYTGVEYDEPAFGPFIP
jgi:hypothetical protein